MLLYSEQITTAGRSSPADPAGSQTPAAAPTKWVLVLHGIFGSGRNWATIARRLVDQRPDLGLRLVDLRGHGRSPNMFEPHTLAAAADDLRKLIQQTGPVHAVIGHSFGGKVAMQLALDPPAGIEQIWTIDASPQAQPSEGRTWQVLTTMRSLPGPFTSRQQAIEAITDRGIATALATWLVSNLQYREPDHTMLDWRLDLDQMEMLLLDYFARDLTCLLDQPPSELNLHMVRAEQSDMIPPDICQRIVDAQQATGRVHLHRLRGGHWLHVDNPDGLIHLLAEHL